MSQGHSLSELASACAARMATGSGAFHDDAPGFAAELDGLLEAVRQSGDRFAFDRDGRPAAIGAVRDALPAMERDLFEAVLEDLACELAATKEALYQIIKATR